MKMTRTQFIALIAVSIAIAMAWLDMTILSVALPSIQKSFDISRNQTQWIMTIYLLFSAVLAFGAGRLSDLFGHHRAFSLGAALFILSSLFCGLSFNVDILIVMRALQAIGGTFAVISGMSYLSTTFPIESRGRANGITTSIASIAPIIAPFLGGLIIKFLNWHWIFFVNVVIGVCIFIPLIKIFFENENPVQEKKIDYTGFIAIGIFTVTITLIFNHIGNWGWTSDKTLSGFLIAFAALLFFIIFELKQSHPIIDLQLFKLTNYVPGCVVMFLSQFVNFFIIFFGVYIQNALGYSPFMTGVLLLPIGILLTAFSSTGGRIADRYGARIPMNIGFFLITIGYILSTIFISSLSYLALLPAFIGYGFGACLLGNPLRISMLKNTPTKQFGMSTAILSGIRQIGGVIGFAVIGTIIAHTETLSVVSGLKKILPTISMRDIKVLQGILSHTPSSLKLLSQFNLEKQSQIKALVLNSYVHSFHSALLFSSVVLLICSVISVLFIKR
ncbi:MAG: hypothetical protein COY58_09150 [Gammaproteobacteria bacterium CG_4_10_14_0_8_um_filter_38_16]|nr:MAG: hypothetical protein COY58_09150 [Gammaproteobacteria bacterium CG_4_10_14_0_8_um_filter_38_16]PJA04158.1 MAG: hypothetical protein COX72_01465 [Gammaproteobacteria bacterium CG_4_10_14_0_2_um_filter_38_22]PJB10099.1 MAG: hypothetical protein CO120_06800 [Gammaproteobacteria bacterium CG_4_9_14_3_um_filter_38_9]